MNLQSVRQLLAQRVPNIEIIELNQSTVTVDLAAEAHNVKPGRIVKAFPLKVENNIILVVAKGDTRLDNKELESTLGVKVRTLSSDKVVNATGHPVGGVCPLGLETPISVYCDVSLKHYVEMLPAAGAIHSAARITPERMAELTSVTWADMCQ